MATTWSNDAMAEESVVVTYVDDSGQTHEVSSVDYVPQEFAHTISAAGREVGAEVPAAAGRETAAPEASGPAIALLAAVLMAVWTVGSKSYLTKVFAGLLAVVLGFYAFYLWSEDGGYMPRGGGSGHPDIVRELPRERVTPEFAAEAADLSLPERARRAGDGLRRHEVPPDVGRERSAPGNRYAEGEGDTLLDHYARQAAKGESRLDIPTE